MIQNLTHSNYELLSSLMHQALVCEYPESKFWEYRAADRTIRFLAGKRARSGFLVRIRIYPPDDEQYDEVIHRNLSPGSLYKLLLDEVLAYQLLGGDHEDRD